MWNKLRNSRYIGFNCPEMLYRGIKSTCTEASEKKLKGIAPMNSHSLIMEKTNDHKKRPSSLFVITNQLL